MFITFFLICFSNIFRTVGLRVGGFWVFCSMLMFETLVGVAMGLAVGAAVPSIESAKAVSSALLTVNNLFAGFYINIASLPIIARWIPFLDFFFWTFNALCVNEYQGLIFVCDGPAETACLTTGEQVLASLSFDHHTILYPVSGLSMLFISYLVIAFIMLLLSVMRFMPLGYTGSKYRRELNLPYDEDQLKDFSDILTDFFIPSMNKNVRNKNIMNINNKHKVLSSVSSPMFSMSQNEYTWGNINGNNININVTDSEHTVLSTLDSPISTISHNDYERGYINGKVMHKNDSSIDVNRIKHTVLSTLDSPMSLISEDEWRYVLYLKKESAYAHVFLQIKYCKQFLVFDSSIRL